MYHIYTMLRTSHRTLLACATIVGSFFALSSDLTSLFASMGTLPNKAAVVSKDILKPVDFVDSQGGVLPQSESKIRIFLMPGHEPDFGGAEYRTAIEREINVDIANHLKTYLESDGRFEVVVGRNNTEWHPELATYFKENWTEIKRWKDEQAKNMAQLVAEGKINLLSDPAPRQEVPSDVAIRLYGINKWVGENDFDMAVHIHVNDYGGRLRNRPGNLTGYVVFVPEDQYSNSGSARMVAEALSDRLDQFFPQSDAKREKGGVVQDQELVALGRYNTSSAPSILIEYGYIYEPQFQKKEVKGVALKEYAYQTYLGLKEFFAPNIDEGFVFKTATLPYVWQKNFGATSEQSVDVFALQVALRKYGLYPPNKKTLTDCPLSGVYGACTRNAIIEFQKKYAITTEDGVVGETTRSVLNSIYK